MRILHFTNSTLNLDQIQSVGNGVSGSGGWMAALLGKISEQADLELVCASFGKERSVQTSPNGRITSHVLPIKKSGLICPVKQKLRLCRDLVGECKPDLLHIHGTENAYGLITARNMVKTPAVISLQGLLGPYSEWYHYFGNRSLMDILRMHRWMEPLALRGHGWAYWDIRKRAKREKEIIQGNRFFMGRTMWDRAYLHSSNVKAQYFNEPRLLRGAFWGAHWKLENAQSHRILFTNAGAPRKGVEVLFEAIGLLRCHYPDIEVAIAGAISRRSGYGMYVRRKMSELGDTVVELGALNAEQMAHELTRSHAFVSCAFIENNANAICEAQLIGMPVVSTYTGGVPSIIEEGRTGLFYPTGDVPMLASRLRQIFEDDALAVRLGEQSHATASQRHEPDSIVQQVLSVYKEILRKTE